MKLRKPTADEAAQAAAVKLRIATGWYVTVRGGRLFPAITPQQAVRTAELYEAATEPGGDTA